MGRSSEEGSRGRKRSTKSEAKMASSEEGTRRRTRNMTSQQAAKAKMASASASDGDRILKLESEEDRKILKKFESEEGKILKLKKEYVAACEARLVPTDDEGAEEKAALPLPARKKMKKVWRLTKMTKQQIDFVKTMATLPCPTRNLTEDQLAQRSKSFQYRYRQGILVRNTRLAYLEALIAQQEKFGCAVDESEAEVTDDEGDSMY